MSGHLFATALSILFAAACFTRAAEPPSTTASDALQNKTNWKGREKNPNGRKEDGWQASAKVVKRDGDKVTINFWTVGNDGRKGCQLDGTIADDGKLRFKVTKTLPGDNWRETVVGTYWTGAVNGKTLTIKRKGHRGADMISELTLQDKDKDSSQ